MFFLCGAILLRWKLLMVFPCCVAVLDMRSAVWLSVKCALLWLSKSLHSAGHASTVDVLSVVGLRLPVCVYAAGHGGRQPRQLTEGGQQAKPTGTAAPGTQACQREHTGCWICKRLVVIAPFGAHHGLGCIACTAVRHVTLWLCRQYIALDAGQLLCRMV